MTGLSFDPAYERSLMVEISLPHMVEFDPEDLPPTSIPQKVSLLVDLLLQCYWIGLVGEAKPRLEAVVDWMGNCAPPEFGLFDPKDDGWVAPWHAHYTWWRSLGLAKWLVDRESGSIEFGNSVNALLDAWQHAPPDHVKEWRLETQFNLSRRLALAIGAGRPVDGLRLIEASGSYRPRPSERPVLKFGRWACEYLASGKSRDDVFVHQGEAMLKSSMMPHFFFEPGGRTDPALWLKVVYFDSGVTRTAEETMLRLYDFMPGVERPDFVPSRS